MGIGSLKTKIIYFTRLRQLILVLDCAPIV